MPTVKLTFYIILSGVCLYWIRLKFGLNLKGSFSAFALVNIVGISLFATALSLAFTALAIHYVGPTPTAILGALEPVSAVFWGVVCFQEQLTPRICLGILLILSSVILVALKKKKGCEDG